MQELNSYLVKICYLQWWKGICGLEDPQQCKLHALPVLCLRKQDLAIKRMWRSLWISAGKTRTKRWKRTWECCWKDKHKGLFTRRTNWKSTAKLSCFYFVLLHISFFGCRRKSMDALRYVISRHFWLSSQVWFLFFWNSLRFLSCFLYRLAAAFPRLFFPVVEF